MKLDDVVWARRQALTGAARATREAAGISLIEAAAVLRVEPSTLSRWERGLRRPRPRYAKRWADLLRTLGA